MKNLSIFDLMYEKYKITKPIRLIELFAGYGSQALALKYLGIDFEHWKTCEWAIKSIQAYKDIHFENEIYQEVEDKEWLIERLLGLGVSINYNEPATRKQLERKKLEELEKIHSNIKINHNLVNIQNVKGKHLNIKETNLYEYIMTYSFPCQDLSLAGKRKGMADKSTRSGMLWEVERILKECEEKPQILIMENVPEVIGTKNIEHFNKWQKELELMGYSNYVDTLIATDYCIPQTRRRTFMVSILGNYSYQFPTKVKLTKKLKDMLEEKVDEKYYLTKKQLEQIQNWNAYEKPLENMVNNEKKGTSPTITTRSGAFAAGMILMRENIKNTLNYIEWKEKGKLDIDCRAWKNVAPTLHTKCGETKIIDKYTKGDFNREQIINPNTSTTTFMENHENVIATFNNHKIRKITPKESFRLMGVKDRDFENCAKNQSKSSLYHLAGDSIVTTVLMGIFGELLGIDYKSKIENWHYDN